MGHCHQYTGLIPEASDLQLHLPKLPPANAVAFRGRASVYAFDGLTGIEALAARWLSDSFK